MVKKTDNSTIINVIVYDNGLTVNEKHEPPLLGFDGFRGSGIKHIVTRGQITRTLNKDKEIPPPKEKVKSNKQKKVT